MGFHLNRYYFHQILESNIGKNLGLFKKIINLNPFENSKKYKFWDFTWIEIKDLIYKNTIFIKFWNANIGKNLGLFKKIIKI